MQPVNLSQLLLDLRKGCVVTYFSPNQLTPLCLSHTGSPLFCRFSLNVSEKIDLHLINISATELL